MSSSCLPLVIGVLLCFLQTGHSLKCYVGQCQNMTSGSSSPQSNCPAPRQEVNCTTIPGSSIPADRCLTLRTSMKMPNPSGIGDIQIDSENWNCTGSLICTTSFRDYTCNLLNQSTNYTALKSCEMGCCEGDLCNSGGPIPTMAPGPTGPTGSDLSCYACSNIPGVSGLVTANASCSSPIKQTCGNDLIPGLKQNQCMRLSVKVSGMQYEFQNCSGSTYCTPGILCNLLKSSLGASAVSDCKVSCCSGNLCNKDNQVSTTSPSTTVTGTGTIKVTTGTGTIKVTAASGIPEANALIVLLVVLMGSLWNQIRHY